MKKFYTDKDIEELVRNGIKSLPLEEDVVLTDLAYEKARSLGLLVESDAPPAAPVRPYLSEVNPPQAQPKADAASSTIPPLPSGEVAKHGEGDRGEGEGAVKRAALEKRIRDRVAAKLGNQVDAALLDTIIKRTLKVVRLK